MSTSKRKCRMMGDIDAARKKERKKKETQATVYASLSLKNVSHKNLSSKL
jgi:hypothetical protein